MAGESTLQLPTISSSSSTNAVAAASMPSFDINEQQMESRGKWAERIGVGPLIAIISLSIITAILGACCAGFYFIATHFIEPTFNDQRDAIKDVAESATESLRAIHAIKGEGESQTRALWKLKENSDKNLELHEKFGESLDRLTETIARGKVTVVGTKVDRPEPPPMPDGGE